LYSRVSEQTEEIEEIGLIIKLGERMAKVSMYTLSTHPVCRKTKNFFLARGIPFGFVDYNLASESEQNKITDDMMKGTCHIAFLFCRIDDVMGIGFAPERFEQLLKSEKLEPATSQA
jgi:hypothetical protein